MNSHLEARVGSLVSAGGIIWAANAATQNFSSITSLLLPVGPLEVCAIGILIWLHAKWRGSVTLR